MAEEGKKDKRNEGGERIYAEEKRGDMRKGSGGGGGERKKEDKVKERKGCS